MTPRARAVRRVFLTTGVLASLGLLACIAGVFAGVVAGGVPFHDGPNAGFASPPGFRRFLEHLAVPLIGVGALLFVAAGLNLALHAALRLVRASLCRRG